MSFADGKNSNVMSVQVLQNQGYFERGDTVITDACILVFYVVMAGAIVSAIYSAVSDALK